MEALPDATAFATKVQNTLIQYHSIDDDKWRVAKKTVNQFNYLYLGCIVYLMNWLMTFKMVWKDTGRTQQTWKDAQCH